MTSHPDRLGVHVLADLTDVTDPACFDPGFLVDAFREALDEAGATVRRTLVEEFSPHGLSVMVVLAESHASLHTWPERRTILIDVFTCGPVAPLPVIDLFAAKLGPCRVEVTQVDRAAQRPGLVTRQPWRADAPRPAGEDHRRSRREARQGRPTRPRS